MTGGELGWMGPAPAPGTGDGLGMFPVLVVGKVGLFATVTSLGDSTMDVSLAWLFSDSLDINCCCNSKMLREAKWSSCSPCSSIPADCSLSSLGA